jgi:hypothetical protein
MLDIVLAIVPLVLLALIVSVIGTARSSRQGSMHES